METPTSERKLLAILVADVVGYSRLMGDDPEATVEALTASRAVFSEYIERHRGRVVNAPGDSILAEFGSVLDAVACAVEIQRELAERNDARPEPRRMEFRIGVNLGDVLVQEGALYGDGVNVAARLEALADPGGICISGKAYQEVQSRLPLEFEFLGKKEVKNIADPVPVFRVLSRPGAAAHRVLRADWLGMRRGKLIGLGLSAVVIVAAVLIAWYLLPGQPSTETAQERPIPPPDKPSIAVLPFTNMSGDPEQEYFADGITEDIITDLSKLRNLMVIARNSTFQYKGQAVDVRRVGRELGVRYVLEGSVRKAEDRIRITAQLIDAENADHIWGERYDRTLQDIFQVQDDITRKIVEELQVRLVEGEQSRVWRRQTELPRAYDNFLRGREIWLQFSRENVALAREFFTRAVELDPQFSAALTYLGWTHHVAAMSGWSESRDAGFELALDFGRRAIESDDSNGDAYSLLSLTKMHLRDIDGAIEYGERAIAFTPNGADVHAYFAIALGWAVDPRAVEIAERAIRLNPNPPPLYWNALGEAHLMVGNVEEAIRANKLCIAQIPDLIWCHVWQAAAYMEVGQETLAQLEVGEILRIDPDATSDWLTGGIKDPGRRTRIHRQLVEAGLP